MIEVICITRNNKFSLVRVSGHSTYARHGLDIVCAGISSIVEGALSFFKTNYHRGLIVGSNQLSTTFSVVNCHDDEVLQACLRLVVHQLRNISHFYPGYITVRFE